MCRIAAFFECWIPWPALRVRLIGRHLRHCPRCLREAEEWPPDLRRAVLGQSSVIAAEPDLWPEVRRRIAEWEVSSRRPQPGRVSRRRLIWVGAAALVVVSVAWLILLQRAQVKPGLEKPTGSRAGFHYAKLGGKTARAHIFQTSQMTFIMITKSEKT